MTRFRSKRRSSFPHSGFAECQQLEDRALLTTVVAAEDPGSEFSYFESREELAEFLIADAIERNASRFGQPAWHRYWPGDWNRPVFRSELSDAVNHSDTNNQVRGVDEGDRIENDGQHLYLLQGSDLIILNALPAEKMSVASRVNVEGSAQVMFLHEERLTVISMMHPQIDVYLPADFNSALVPPAETVVTTFDVSNPTEPTVTQQTTIEGRYLSSRAIDGRVHVVTDQNVSLPGPRLVPIEHDPETDANTDTDVPVGEELRGLVDILVAPRDPSQMFESRETYEAWLRSEIDNLMNDALPKYQMTTANGLSAEGLVSDISEIAAFHGRRIASLTSVVTIDSAIEEPGLTGSTSVFGGGRGTAYATADHFYLAAPLYHSGSSETHIMQFAWGSSGSNPRLVAAGRVPGVLLNQFAMDEHDGFLRVATTTRDLSVAANSVYVLKNTDGELKPVGILEGFGEDETIRSVRFSGDRAFVVTFRIIDPLFMIDLSDPENPAITGELEVPGFSTHLRRIDADHLLAIGRIDGTTKVSVYNVGDPANPTLVDEDVLPPWTSTSAHHDPQAFGWYGEHSLLTLPVRTHGQPALLAFSIDPQANGEETITLRGEVGSETTVFRSAFIGDVLYTITRGSVIATSIDDPSTEIGRVDGLSDKRMHHWTLEPRLLRHRDGASRWLRPAVDAIGDTVRRTRTEDLTVMLPDLPVEVEVRDHQLVLTTEAGQETFALPDRTRLELVGTEGDDHVRVNLAEAAAGALAAFSVRTQAGDDTIQLVGLHEGLPYGRLFGGAGDDSIRVESPLPLRQKLFGGEGNDTLLGGAGNDLIEGGPGDDSLIGGAGDDRLVGHGGQDRIRGLDGHDTLTGGGADDRLYGGRGGDLIRGGRGNDRLHGSNGADSLEGNAGDDEIRGHAGNDTLLDVLTGTVNDLFAGGRGRDRFVVTPDAAEEILDRLFDFHEEEDWLFDLIA